MPEHLAEESPSFLAWQGESCDAKNASVLLALKDFLHRLLSGLGWMPNQGAYCVSSHRRALVVERPIDDVLKDLWEVDLATFWLATFAGERVKRTVPNLPVTIR